jgi:hypothetical protein
MKKSILIALTVFTIGCNEKPAKKNPLAVYQNGGVEQQLTESDGIFLCGESRCITTVVWINQKIAWSKYIPVTASDSIIHADSLQGVAIYNKLKRHVK